jgi:beta-phosphoglucomutase-like phosphatase (HAD superfamily)
MRLDPFIFDMEGVVIDTVEYHYLSWQRLANEEGFLLNRKIYDQLRGLNHPAPMRVILEANGMNASPEQIEE